MSAFDVAWTFIKALPEQQLFTTDLDRYGYPENLDGPNAFSMGTIHPSALAMYSRKQANSPPGSVQIRRLERPDTGIQERTGSPEYATWDKRNKEDIERYGIEATGHWERDHPDFRVRPHYPDRDSTYLDTPLNLEGGR